jgi:hypothetical protein
VPGPVIPIPGFADSAGRSLLVIMRSGLPAGPKLVPPKITPELRLDVVEGGDEPPGMTLTAYGCRH